MGWRRTISAWLGIVLAGIGGVLKDADAGDVKPPTHLLHTSDPADWHDGLLALRGCPIDRDLLAVLGRMLNTKHLNVRRAAAYVIQKAPNDTLTRGKALAIIRSTETVSDVPGAQEGIALAGHSGKVWSNAGYTYSCFIRALSGMKGADPVLLKELMPEEPENARDCVFVARAWLSDLSVKEEIHRIMRGSKVPRIRRHAVDSLTRIGSPEDVSVLKELSESDPFGVEMFIPPTKPGELPRRGEVHPIRAGAERVIKTIQRKQEKAGVETPPPEVPSNTKTTIAQEPEGQQPVGVSADQVWRYVVLGFAAAAAAGAVGMWLLSRRRAA